MQWLAELSVRRPVFGTVIVLSLVVVGAFSYFRLGVDLFPKVDFPSVSITTRQTGAAPEEIEIDITDKIERAVNTIAGIDELRSVSTEGVSQVFVQFKLEKDIDVAQQEVQAKVNQILPDLPRDIEQPVVDKIDPDAAPVLYVAVSANRPVREISEFADKTVRRELEGLSGVGDVRIVGGRPRRINIQLDPTRLRAYNLTAVDVARAIENQNLQLPGGSVSQGQRELTVRMKGRVPAVKEFEDVVVAARGGVHIRLRDVALSDDDIMREADRTGEFASRAGALTKDFNVRELSNPLIRALFERQWGKQEVERILSDFSPDDRLSLFGRAGGKNEVQWLTEHLQYLMEARNAAIMRMAQIQQQVQEFRVRKRVTFSALEAMRPRDLRGDEGREGNGDLVGARGKAPVRRQPGRIEDAGRVVARREIGREPELQVVGERHQDTVDIRNGAGWVVIRIGMAGGEGARDRVDGRRAAGAVAPVDPDRQGCLSILGIC